MLLLAPKPWQGHGGKIAHTDESKYLTLKVSRVILHEENGEARAAKDWTESSEYLMKSSNHYNYRPQTLYDRMNSVDSGYLSHALTIPATRSAVSSSQSACLVM